MMFKPASARQQWGMRVCVKCRERHPTETISRSGRCEVCALPKGLKCRRCGEKKPHDQFPKAPSGRVSGSCHQCHATPIKRPRKQPRSVRLQVKRRGAYREAMRKGRYEEGTTFEEWAGKQCLGNKVRPDEVNPRRLRLVYSVEQQKEKRRKAYRKRYRNNPEYNLAQRIKSSARKHRRFGCINTRLRTGLSANKSRGGGAVFEFLGYGPQELKRHLERQFTEGMNWESFCSGEIHIDHVIPVSSFDLTSEEEVRRCWSLTNLQPLWAEENLEKGSQQRALV